jgi:hypothetical protein
MSASDVESGTDILNSSGSAFLIEKDTLNVPLVGTECAIIYAAPTTVTKNDTHWNPMNRYIGKRKKDNFDTLPLYALDRLSCLIVTTQCGRVFSAARRTLTLERNALGMKINEACEYLWWW